MYDIPEQMQPVCLCTSLASKEPREGVVEDCPEDGEPRGDEVKFLPEGEGSGRGTLWSHSRW